MKILTTRPSYSSFLSAWCTDFKNVIFEKIHWATSEVIEVKRSLLRSLRPNFGFHLVLTNFHLEFSSFWIWRLFDLGNLSVLRRSPGNFFKNNIFKISAFQRKRWGMSQLYFKIFTKPLHRGGVILVASKFLEDNSNRWSIFVSLLCSFLQRDCFLKFIYSEKAPKFCAISNLLLTGTT